MCTMWDHPVVLVGRQGYSRVGQRGLSHPHGFHKVLDAGALEYLAAGLHQVDAELSLEEAVAEEGHAGAGGEGAPEVGFLNILGLFQTTFQTNSGIILEKYRASHVLVDWVLLTWIWDVPPPCLGSR